MTARSRVVVIVVVPLLCCGPCQSDGSPQLHSTETPLEASRVSETYRKHLVNGLTLLHGFVNTPLFELDALSWDVKSMNQILGDFCSVGPRLRHLPRRGRAAGALHAARLKNSDVHYPGTRV